MWIEIVATAYTFIYFLDVIRKYAEYFKDYIEKEPEKPISEEAKRMFS
jgi:hypothetical protein